MDMQLKDERHVRYETHDMRENVWMVTGAAHPRSGDQILIGVDIATCLKYFIVLHHAPQPRAEAYLYFIITFVTGASVEKLCRDILPFLPDDFYQKVHSQFYLKQRRKHRR